MTDDDVTFLKGMIGINLAPDYKYHLNDELHIILQWRLNVPVTVKYLRNFYAPVIKWKIHYTTVTPTATNHVLTEFSHPKLISLSTV